MTTRPRRAANRINVVRVLRGADPDGLLWRTGTGRRSIFIENQPAVGGLIHIRSLYAAWNGVNLSDALSV